MMYREIFVGKEEISADTWEFDKAIGVKHLAADRYNTYFATWLFCLSASDPNLFIRFFAFSNAHE